jgi:hypothetical protein
MALIKEIGTLIFKSQVESGTSRNGYDWKRQTIVVEVPDYQGTFRKVALAASGDRVEDVEALTIGEKIEVLYKVSAREWEGKWYNSVDLIKVSGADDLPEEQPAAPAKPKPRKTSPLVDQREVEPKDDDLPI